MNQDKFEFRKYEITLTPITPIHIGDGNKLSPFEIYREEKKLYVVNSDKLFKKLGEYGKIEEFTRKIEEISRDRDKMRRTTLDMILDEIGIKDIGPKEIYDYELNGEFLSDNDLRNINEVSTIIKTYDVEKGKLVPYIPGSSVKGAIRTAILNHLLNGRAELLVEIIKNSNNYRELSGKKRYDIEKNIMGNNSPYTDLMKYIEISDLYPIKDAPTHVLKVESYNRGNSSRGIRFTIEAIATQTPFKGVIKITSPPEEYIKMLTKERDSKYRFPPILFEKGMLNIDDIKKYIREYYSQVISYDLKHLDIVKNSPYRYQNPLKYNEYKDQITGLFQGDDLIIRIGAHKGFFYNTLIHNIMNYSEYYKKLGLRYKQTSPKTRKMGHLNHELTLLGWCTIEFNEVE